MVILYVFVPIYLLFLKINVTLYVGLLIDV